MLPDSASLQGCTGYESSSNNGVRSYSDLDDYWDGDDSLITPELKAAAIEYLKKKDTEFYRTMIMNKIKHVIAGDWKLELHKSGLTDSSSVRHDA